jgi:hypothetical protein
MSKGNTTENDIVEFLFNNVAMPSYGSNLYLSLHTADPDEAGDQTTNEVSYTGGAGNYARVAVSRDAGGWTVSGNQSSNAALVQFAVSNTGPVVVTHLGIGTSASGAGQLLAKGALSASLTINNLVQPQFAIGGVVYQED